MGGRGGGTNRHQNWTVLRRGGPYNVDKQLVHFFGWPFGVDEQFLPLGIQISQGPKVFGTQSP
jgi:hypothetical protein